MNSHEKVMNFHILNIVATLHVFMPNRLEPNFELSKVLTNKKTTCPDFEDNTPIAGARLNEHSVKNYAHKTTG